MGLKSTPIEVVDCGETVIGNVLDEKLKSAVSVPVIPMLLITRFPLPVFVTTTFLEELVVLRGWLPKFMEPGRTEAPGVPTGRAVVDQLVLETEEALVQLAVAVFKIVPLAVAERLTAIVIVSVSLLAIEANVTVTVLPEVVHAP